jgi:serine/threonine protein kinase
MRLRELTDRYQIEQMLTRSGNVLRARDLQSQGAVAIKMVKASGPALEQAAPRFEKLGEILAALRHPNLPAVLDWGFTTDGSPFLVMELLAGQRLDALADPSPLRRLHLVLQAVNALELLASKGVGHWNLAPGNLFVVSSGPAEQVKLLGLGTAVFGVGEEGGRFRAPELVEGRGADWRADLFSLAATACQLLGVTASGDPLTVQLPFALSLELADDGALRQILERSLARHPAVRPSHREMREALLLALGLRAPAPQTAAVGAQPQVLGPRPVPPPPPLRPAAPSPTEPRQPATGPQPLVTPPASPPPAAMPPVAAAEGGVLSDVDEALNALLSVPPPPPLPAGPPAGRRPAPAGARVVPFQKPREGAAPTEAVPAAGRPQRPRRPWLPLALGAAAGILILGVVLVYLLVLRKPAEVVVEAPPPPAPVRPTQPPAAERLEEARLHAARGEWNQARLILRSLSFEDQGALGSAGCRVLAILEETLAQAALATLPEDLAAGLKEGDIALLQNAVAGATEQGVVADLSTDVRADFERARGLVELYGQAQAAAAGGRHPEVLERFQALTQILPNATDPEDLRNRAASAIEAEAATLIAAAKYDAGIAKLEPTVRTWPDRPGLEELVEKYRTFRQNEAAQLAVLAKLPGVERRKKPHEGIEEIAKIEPTPHLAPRFEEARRKLEDQMSQLDRNPPEIVLRDDVFLEYFRGTPVELSFRVTDDYQVQEVQMFARVGKGKMQELELEATRAGIYKVLIPANYHNNSTVDFYVVATDRSGHSGYFGTPEEPQHLIRRQ